MRRFFYQGEIFIKLIRNYAIFIPLLILTTIILQPQISQSHQKKTLVIKLGKIAGEATPFLELLKEFERKNAGLNIKVEFLPSSTDEQHQFYIINLESGSSDFDLFSMDVIWVPEFARAGWLRELSHLLTAEERDDFFAGPLQAVQLKGKIYALPWYIDAGLLYYRRDLLQKYNFSPPQTWFELVAIARAISTREEDCHGFLWQGKQYEGLVCNVLEFIWSNGGKIISADGQPVVYRKANEYALQFMRDLITRYQVSPSLVTTAVEETTRYIFGNGRAVFMRNWPYAWPLLQRKNSPVKDKVGIALLPFFPGHSSVSTLGGWQLGINKFSQRSELAEKLLKFLTSPSSQKALALTIGYQPPRRSLYFDLEIIEKQPFLASLYDIFSRARPRPITPYYIMISQVIQPEFSAAISGIKSPAAALRSAQKQIEHILRMEK